MIIFKPILRQERKKKIKFTDVFVMPKGYKEPKKKLKEHAKNHSKKHMKVMKKK